MTESTTTKPLGLLGWCARALGALAATVLLSAAPPAAAFHFPWDQGHDTTSSNDPPPPGPCEGPTCDDDCGKNASRSPVYAALGHAIWRDTDVMLRGRPYVGVYRVYNSNDPVVGLFGNGWSVCFDVALYPANSSGVQERIYKAPNGKRFAFVKQADGSFLAPAGRFETIVEGPTSVAMTTLDGRRNVFAPDGRLLERVDANGSRVSFGYDSAGRPVSMADTNGRSLSLAYNASGLVDTVSDHTGRIWRYGYDANANLVSVTDPAGGVMRYTWQAYRPAGDANTYYQLLSATDASNVVAVSFVYTGNRVASYTEGANRITYTRLAGNTNSSGSVTQRDALNVPRTFDYGALALVTRDVDGIGGVTRYTYDANGRITSTIDALGRTWSSTYDSLGRLTLSTDPLGRSTANGYTGNEVRPTLITSPGGRQMRMSYDARGNLSSLTDPSGAVTSMTYNTAGDILTLTNALGQRTSMGYTATGLPTTITDPQGRSTSTAYDALGRVSSTTNAAGEVTRYTYDVLDRVATMTDPLNQITSFGYDAAGRLLSVTDAKGSVTRFEYDTFGRRTAEVEPDGRRTVYAYRLDNLLSSITWPGGSVTSWQYDANKRVTSETAGTETITYTYNGVNQMLTASGAGGNVSYAYDAAGRVTSETNNGRTNVISRNIEGERVRLDYLGISQSYTRDSRGLVTRLSAPAGDFDLGYDALGRRVSLAYPTGASVAYGFDDAGQLGSITHAGAFSSTRTQVFDAAGRITRLSGDGPDRVQSYDAAGRLTGSVQGADNAVFTLDAVGNILDGGRNYDVNHRLTSDASSDYSYDTRGNLTLERNRSTGARTAYTWNARAQLTRVESFDSAAATTPSRTLQFTYDALGRRASKTDNGVLRRFVYDGDDLIGELDGAGAVLSTQVFSGVIDEPLASTSGASSRMLHADHLASIVAVSEGSTLTHSYGYAPYGAARAGSSADSTPFRFTGREKDGDDLYYYRARYYSPSKARFISPDPMGLEAGLSPYGYADNDPFINNDPSGNCPWCVGALVGGLTDLAIQLAFNGFNLKCVSWTEVAVSAAAGAIGAGIAQKMSKVSTVLKGANRPTYRVFKSKAVRVEMHPPGNRYPDWFSYPHWHPDFAGKPWSKMHWPVLEPLIGVPAAAHNATKEDCGCQ